ncbi:MAG TPA: hypothetical protein VF173_11750, partial [Thermoanaerobaculia bacterium]|nr:hypothetical protein [Thermoanaerobaculia bacterium]
MEPDRWQRIRPIFQAALEAGPEERPARLAEHCGEDAELRAEIESLLAANERAAGFLSGCGEE